MEYLDRVYLLVKDELEGMDAVYEETILDLVGQHGLRALKENKLLEACGVLNGRQLYTLLETGRVL